MEEAAGEKEFQVQDAFDDGHLEVAAERAGPFRDGFETATDVEGEVPLAAQEAHETAMQREPTIARGVGRRTAHTKAEETLARGSTDETRKK